MIINLPPHIEQAIIAKAQAQGLTVQEMLTKDYDSEHMAEQHGLNTHSLPLLSDDELQALIKRYGGLNA